MVRPDFFVAEMLDWAMAALSIVLLVELILAAATLRYAVFFFRALLPGSGPLGHSTGNLDDLFCIPHHPVLDFSPSLMASDCTFQGDHLNESERETWRYHIAAFP